MTTARIRPLFLPLLIALAVLLCPGTAAPAIAQGEPTPSAAIRGAMQEFIDAGEIAGAVAVVGDSRGLVSLVAVGRRDIEGNLPMEENTLFRIASMTKPITALGVLILADEGRLAIDDPVEKHLPEFRGQAMAAGGRPSRPIILRDLLTHTSGLPDGSPPGSRAGPATTLEDAAGIFATRPLSFEPGSRWSYSNAGMGTLGRVIEVASGQSYEAFLKGRLFDPLAMKDTTFYPDPGQMKRLATTYDRGGRLVAVASSRVAPARDKRHPGPAGGLYSTGPDLARIDRMLLGLGTLDGRRYLAGPTLAEMTRLQTGDLQAGFTRGMGFGLGVGIVRRPTGVTAMLSPGSFGHGGAYGTQNWVDPHKGRFAILLIQRVGLESIDDTPMRLALQRIAFEGRD